MVRRSDDQTLFQHDFAEVALPGRFTVTMEVPTALSTRITPTIALTTGRLVTMKSLYLSETGINQAQWNLV
jgi:hypothetical protein